MKKTVESCAEENYSDVKEIVNLTPQEITIFQEDSEQIKIPPSGMMARVRILRNHTTLKGFIRGNVKIMEYRGNQSVPVKTFNAEIPIMKPVFESVTGIPDPKPGTIYLVSSMVAQAVPDRMDVLSPDTLPGGSLKGFGGVMGIKSLQSWHQS